MITYHNSPARRLLLSLVSSLMLLALTHPASADVTPGPKIDAAVERGLKFLSAQQKPDGSIEDGQNKLATTALSLMAYMAAGQTADLGRDGLVIRAAVDFLVKSVPADGYVGGIDGSRMYGHGIVTLALAEASGVETDPDRQKQINAVVTRMVGVILKAQSVNKDDNNKGGWRYEPTSNDSDLSLSGWCILALRAAQNSGVPVAKEPVDRAVAYVARCYNEQAGAFAYQPGAETLISMTSVALLDLHLLGAAERPEVKKAAKWLGEHPIKSDTPFFYYSLYYSTQASTQVGGRLAEQVWDNNSKLLLGLQQQDGGFAPSPNGQEPGRVYATSMSVLALTVPYQLLPIYQR